MGTIVVVYELDNPAPAHPSPGIPGTQGQHVRKVHAAPTAPGEPAATGPRTLCGKDTFAMEAGPLTTEDGGTPWYPAQYVSVVCPDCDAVIET
ncbi:hypothetical protein [Streptomyces regalis]|uniref:Uncharacterized protein n=1 Tax=Streptomyces regalis TaxID=68262 RepID=A0A0X3VHE6_9ACTN|nr:hypothetical protein [Streptomyces regalis]KUL44120.1 hypothetical protein ADL12_06170 [Streptomyces regalis]